MRKAKSYRPIELVHDFNFIPCCFPQNVQLPSPKDRLDKLKALGYGGVALSPSYASYLSEESFKETREIIKYAREIGLTVWIYDEKYYPSGSADGTVAKENPRFEAKALCAVVGEPDDHGIIYVNSPHGYGSVLYAFACDTDGNGEPIYSTLRDVNDKRTFGGGIVLDCGDKRNARVYAFFGKNAFEFATTSHNTRGIRRYADTLMPEAMKAFISKTFDGYKELGKLSEYVEAVFTNEPQIPALCRTDYRSDYAEFLKSIENDVFVVRDNPDGRVAFTPYFPWTEALPEAFTARHGYDLIPKLPQAFFDEGEEGKKLRTDFWDTVSALFAESYGGVYSDFCHSNGVAYSGHLLYEEEFDIHPYMHGDPLYQLGIMDIPGCDMLFASPTEILNHASAVKLAASAAALYGKSDVMIEASNITKDVFPITEEALNLATAIEAALGATRFLSYYTETAMDPSSVSRCCDFTDRLLTALSDTAPAYRAYVYLPNGDISSEAYPSVSWSDKKPLSEKLSLVRELLRSISQVLPRRGIDFAYVNDERLSALKDTDLFSSSALIIPPFVETPKDAVAFDTVITAKTAEEAADILTERGYHSISAPQSFITLKKSSERKEAILIVNIGGDFSGEIILRSTDTCSNVTVYDPHTDVTANATVNHGKINVSIPQNHCMIIFKEDQLNV